MLDRRLHMVNSQLRTGGMADKVVLAAFLEVPRQRFVAPEHESLAYLDRELPARGAKFRRLLAPMVLARMLQAVTVVPPATARSMLAGGSGYGAALLAAMGAKVVLLESDAGAAETAKSRLSQSCERQWSSARSTAGPPLSDLLISSSSRARLASFPTDSSACSPIPDVLSALTRRPNRLRRLFTKKTAAGSVVGCLFETKADILDGFKPEVSFAF